MSGNNSTKIGNVGDFPTIETLAAEHDRVTAEIAGLPKTPAGDEEAERLNNRQWALRALIESIPPKTPPKLYAMARILKNEIARDPHFECHVSGSARGLARAFSDAVMATQAAV
jgi:hypothetical protein